MNVHKYFFSTEYQKPTRFWQFYHGYYYLVYIFDSPKGNWRILHKSFPCKTFLSFEKDVQCCALCNWLDVELRGKATWHILLCLDKSFIFRCFFGFFEIKKMMFWRCRSLVLILVKLGGVLVLLSTYLLWSTDYCL